MSPAPAIAFATTPLLDATTRALLIRAYTFARPSPGSAVLASSDPAVAPIRAASCAAVQAFLVAHAGHPLLVARVGDWRWDVVVIQGTVGDRPQVFRVLRTLAEIERVEADTAIWREAMAWCRGTAATA